MKVRLLATALIAAALTMHPSAMRQALDSSRCEARMVENRILAAIAKAKSSSALITLRRKLPDTYRSQLVFAARWFELHPKDKRAALALLDLIPAGEARTTDWIQLGVSVCGTEPREQMLALFWIEQNLPRDFSTAVMVAPQRMREYVEYSLDSAGIPESDYAVQMERVCRARNVEFSKAVAALTVEQRAFFRGHVFKVKRCKAIALPEQ